MLKDSKIFVAGHRGLVGSAIIRKLKCFGYTNILTREKIEIDLRDPCKVKLFFEDIRPEYVFVASAKVGGIKANNNYPVEFLQDNLLIQSNILKYSYEYNVKKLLFLGSSCIYPKEAKQPIKEEALLSGSLEETNRSYALAKIAGLELCRSYNRQYGTNYISAMPCNVYGIEDSFDLENSHVLPALIRRFYEAQKEKRSFVELWGTGEERREFIYSDDLAEGLIFLMNNYEASSPINIGTGRDWSISSLAYLIKKITGFEGGILFLGNLSGTQRKLLDISKITDLGWESRISLRDGIEKTYNWFVDTQNTYRGREE